MIGVWRFQEHSAKKSDFQIIRKVDGNMYFQEVLPSAKEGIRTGWLQMMRSLDKDDHDRCRFKTTLTDGAVVHLLLRQADGSSVQTLEVSQVGQHAFPLLAKHTAPLEYDLDTLAWILAVVVLLSGPLATLAFAAFGQHPPADLQTSDGVAEQHQHSEKQAHEDWMDVLRLCCILFMISRHAIQSLERLQQAPTIDFSGVLHGLPLFVYVAGKGFGLAVSSKGASVVLPWKAQLRDNLAFLKRRAMQLVLPSILGTVFVVIPTEYVGRKWRTCGKGPDSPIEWLKAYVTSSHGLRCEGLGWLGFMLSLFIMQAMLRPWAVSLHRRVVASSRQVMGEDLGWTMLWVSAGISLGSIGLHGIGPHGVGGLLRPDTALTLAPPMADLLSLSLVWNWRKSKGSSADLAAVASLRTPALLRRVVASVGMAALTKRFAYDDFLHGERTNESGLWIELCLLTVFYQQGVVDGILRDVPAARDPLTSKLISPLRRAEQAYTALMSTWPRLREFFISVFAWSLWWFVSSYQVTGTDLLFSPGYRYPAYFWGTAGLFVLRSWIVLGVAVWWWGYHLPAFMRHLQTVASFGFTLYVLHWFFIETVLSALYGSPHPPGPGDVPWWLALVIALTLTLVASSLCHMAMKVVMGQGVHWKWSNNELVVKIKTGHDDRKC
jgi:hypothetical protein